MNFDLNLQKTPNSHQDIFNTSWSCQPLSMKFPNTSIQLHQDLAKAEPFLHLHCIAAARKAN